MSETQTTTLVDTLAHLVAFAARRENRSNALRVEELIAKLQTQTFNLVVFGEFKRGKTTFINALLGQDLLPSAVVPLTSVVTVLHYGPSAQVEVEFLDGHREIGTPGILPDYVTEKGNPQNVRQVKVVRVAVPSALLRNGLQLVDTPGVGSVYEHNTETTRDFLEQVDGAILLVASDPPISRGECEFLMEMKPHVARLFVVQNKIDQLRPAEATESLEFTEGVLCDVLGRGEVEVFPLSAREALEAQLSGDKERLESSGLLRFVEELRRFQAEEQAQTLVASVVRNALEVAEDEQLGLDLERQAMTMSLEDIENRFNDFRRRRDQLLTQREDDTTLIRAAARKLIAQTLHQDYEEERKTRAPELRRRFAEWTGQQRDTQISELVALGNVFVRETLIEVLTRWRQAEEKRLEQELADTLQRFTTRANEALGTIYGLAREVFQLPPRSVETVGYLAAPSRFRWQDWQWEARPGLSGSALGGWLPGARERTLRTIEEKLLDEHDKACGRLRYDFAERAQVAFDDYVRSVGRSLSEAIAGIDRAIERAIAQKQRTAGEAEETAERIRSETAELQELVVALGQALPTGVEAP
jgi:signal recognition particle receptor subunit beta